MSAGDILLYGALLSACLATVLFFIGRTKLSILLTRIAVALTTLAVLLLAYAFVSLDFSLFYVWQFSSAEMSIFYRLAAILVGQEGTYLVWAWLSLAVVLMYIELRGVPERADMLASGYALIGCVFLLVLTIRMTPFKSIFLMGGAALPTSGNGISHTLVDLLMPLHIFTAFVAYAFLIVPAAVSLAYLAQREKMPDIKNYLRFSWLFLTICMIVGGIWANRLIGWDGFWQWDPIQTTTMAIWLALTASLHANVRFKFGRYKRIFPLLCINSFLACLYTTLVARSDAYASIHSFPGTPTWWMLVAFMAIVFIYSLMLALRKSVTVSTSATNSKPSSAVSDGIRTAFEPRNTFDITILILIIMTFMCLWGPTLHVIFWFIGQEMVISREFYNALFYLMIVALTYLTGVCLLYGTIKKRTLAYVLSIYLSISFILAIAVPYSAHSLVTSDHTVSFMEKILGSVSITSYLPAFFFVTGSIIYKMARDFKVKRKIQSIHLTGVNVVHLGFVFVVLGAILSTSFASTYNFSYELDEKGVYKENGGIGIRYLDFSIKEEGTELTQIVDIEITDGKTYNTTTVFWKSPQFGFISRPAVIYGWISDIQVGFRGTYCPQTRIENIELNVKKQPLLSLMRAGWVMLIVGVLLTLMSDGMRKYRKRKL